MHFSFRDGFKKLLKENNLKQKDFVELFRFSDGSQISLDRIKKWTKQKEPNTPPAETLIEICKFFDCDMDHLFDNISEHTHDLAFICEYTGLSEETVIYLHDINQARKDWIEALPEGEPDEMPQFVIFEKLLSSDLIFSIAGSIFDYKDNFKAAKSIYSHEIDGDRSPRLSASLGSDYLLRHGNDYLKEAQFAILDAQYKITEFAYSNYGKIEELKELQKKSYIENESRKEG